MSKSRRAFIFDLDGTLVDSEQQIYSAILETSNLMNTPSITAFQLHTSLGLPLKDILQPLNLDPVELKKFTGIFRELLQREIQKENRLFSNVIDFLEIVRENQFLIGIATSKPSRLAQLVVSNSKLVSLVVHTQGTDGFLPKPDPTVIFECMKALNVVDALMFGDRSEDMKAANAANIPGIGIAQSFHDEIELSDSGAELVYKNFGEALGNFDRIVSCFG